jgi:hypothetical protein
MANAFWESGEMKTGGGWVVAFQRASDESPRSKGNDPTAAGFFRLTVPEIAVTETD